MGWEDENNKRRKPDSDGPPDIDEIFRNLLDKLSNKNKKNPFDRKDNGKPTSNVNITFNIKWIWALFGGIFFLWVVMGFYVVTQQERAVVLRLGRYYDTLQAGLHWQPYLVDTVEKVNVTAVRSTSTLGSMLTKDENIVQVNLTVQYVVANARDYLLKINSPLLSLTNALDSALRHVVGSSTMSSVLTDGREEVSDEVAQRLQSYLNVYEAGIDIIRVNIQNTQAPVEVQAAFDDVIKAREDEQRFQNDARTYANGVVPEARGRAQRILQDAQAYKEQKIATATGDASRFTQILEEYQKAPVVTRERLYYETIERILSTTNKVLIDGSQDGNGSGNNIFYIPLDRILDQQVRQAAPSPSVSRNNANSN